MQKTITIFGSSIPQHGDEQYTAAEKLGELLALRGFNVCSGGNLGVMEAVSKGAVATMQMQSALLSTRWDLLQINI